MAEHRESGENALVDKALEKFNCESLLVESVKVYGTSYKLGNVVVLDKKQFGELFLGVIKLMVFSNKKLQLYCSSIRALQSRHNFYMTQEPSNENIWITLENIKDYYPLTLIGKPNSFRISLHHFISKK